MLTRIGTPAVGSSPLRLRCFSIQGRSSSPIRNDKCIGFLPCCSKCKRAQVYPCLARLIRHCDLCPPYIGWGPLLPTFLINYTTCSRFTTCVAVQWRQIQQLGGTPSSYRPGKKTSLFAYAKSRSASPAQSVRYRTTATCFEFYSVSSIYNTTTEHTRISSALCHG